MNFRSVLYIIGLLISTLGCMMTIPTLYFNNHKIGVYLRQLE